MKAKDLAEFLMRNPNYNVSILWEDYDGDLHQVGLEQDSVYIDTDNRNSIVIDISDYT